MKLRILSKAAKASRREGLWKTQQRWHPVYLWWPTRTDPHTVQWLERVARRRPPFLSPHSRTEKRELRVMNRQWEYGHITNVLISTNEQEHVATVGLANQQSPAQFPNAGQQLFGHGVLGPQAGCVGLPGGLSIPPGNFGQNFQNQAGLANAGAAAHGASNQITP